MNDKLQSAKIDVVLSADTCFYASLICNLKVVEDVTCDTAWTDGTHLGYNPTYINSLSHAEIVGLLAHEALHCANGHPWRRDNRDPEKWNIACDLAINPIVIDSNLSLPNGALKPSTEEMGKSAEWIYDRLPNSPKPQGGGSGQGQGQQGKGKPVPGEVRDAPQGTAEDTLTEEEWRELTKQAATQAKMMGKLPGSLDRFAKEVVRTKLDWRSQLRQFFEMNAKNDYCWQRPNVRYLSQDIYLPSLHSESMPRVAIAVDTSGSIDAVALAKAKGEVQAVLDEVMPEGMDLFYADARVANHDSFERGEPLQWRPAGGGGTDFRPVFDAIDKLESPPVVVIYITDLYGTFPEGCDIPTLWITDNAQVAPFGETIRMED